MRSRRTSHRQCVGMDESCVHLRISRHCYFEPPGSATATRDTPKYNDGLPMLHASISCKWTMRISTAQSPTGVCRGHGLTANPNPSGLGVLCLCIHISDDCTRKCYRPRRPSSKAREGYQPARKTQLHLEAQPKVRCSNCWPRTHVPKPCPRNSKLPHDYGVAN